MDGVIGSCAPKLECEVNDTVSVCSDKDFSYKLGVTCYVGQYNMAKHIACIPGQFCQVILFVFYVYIQEK